MEKKFLEKMNKIKISEEEYEKFHSGKMSVDEIISYNDRWCILHPDPWMDEPLTPEEEAIFNSADTMEVAEIWNTVQP